MGAAGVRVYGLATALGSCGRDYRSCERDYRSCERDYRSCERDYRSCGGAHRYYLANTRKNCQRDYRSCERDCRSCERDHRSCERDHRRCDRGRRTPICAVWIWWPRRSVWDGQGGQAHLRSKDKDKGGGGCIARIGWPGIPLSRGDGHQPDPYEVGRAAKPICIGLVGWPRKSALCGYGGLADLEG